MGAHFYRRTRRRNATADTQITIEADISAWGRQHHTARVARAGCACPAKQQCEKPQRWSLTIVGLLQNRSLCRRLGPERV